MTVDEFLKFLYNNSMTKKILLTAILLMLLSPNLAHAYLNPEDVLLNRELFLPPSSREADDRASLQGKEAAARREREQQRAFELQNPKEPVLQEEEPEVLHGSAPQMPAGGFYVYPAAPAQQQTLFGSPANAGLTESANLELMRTMRLLDRVNQNQVAPRFEAQTLHSGAGDLAPTGAGGVVAVLTMIGAVFGTLLRAGRVKVRG